MNKTVFEISQMDCPSEESLIRMKLDGLTDIAHLDFNIPNRRLTVFHQDTIVLIEASLHTLNLGTIKLSTESTNQTNFHEDENQRKLLWTVLVINFAFFLIEITTGLIS